MSASGTCLHLARVCIRHMSASGTLLNTVCSAENPVRKRGSTLPEVSGPHVNKENEKETQLDIGFDLYWDEGSVL
ncbi:hypothetical protein STEG23_000877, partial [Scotinomys teguina]